MTDHPILFSPPMVSALLDGRKTQTRRIIHGVGNDNCMTLRKATGNRTGLRTHVIDAGDYGLLPYKVGDRLWARENFQLLSFGDYAVTKDQPCDIRYVATERLAECPADVRGYRWRPSIHMPRWASRITLAVTDVRVQRLQDISEADARAEGATSKEKIRGYNDREAGWSMDLGRVGEKSEYSPGGRLTERCICLPDAQMAFANYFNRIYGHGAWGSNPWVTAITFTAHNCNIDRMAA